VALVIPSKRSLYDSVLTFYGILGFFCGVFFVVNIIQGDWLGVFLQGILLAYWTWRFLDLKGQKKVDPEVHYMR
jgi:hypothetical protein